ncbi:SNF-7-like protein, putative [Trypanosoma cruzi]|uniref:Putative SNF-7-like protein n=1 Tax=Trypanosoma cruzi TaxID=5693 RepID=A0A2V2V1A4_TRYCR|nr:SNF-7-like protein, putative [Trypanosoma cruzi]KAF8280000.1 putative SNF-7-like protein [Trypanosoma cruzi]PBJ69540.1 SNF-7-like protein [Trypanosoma cruzi cruzi]PWU90021.1 putative SNF-7-like protein [Trypanosoma cruzi]RNF20166.1 putative SNF-7-like protein [Trypanosoma cruzi]
MNRLFGKKNKTPKPTLEDASVRLNTRSEAVDARVSKIDAELMKLKDAILKTSGTTQMRYKQRAMQLLQQKRLYQNQQDMMMQQQFNMDQLQFTTESVKDTKVQLDALKEATKGLKREFKRVDLSKIDNMQEELRDLYEDTQEVQEILGRAYDVPEEIDEDEMMGELDAIAFDMEKEPDPSYLADALATPGTKLPEIPGKEKPQNENEETVDPYSLETQLGL